MNQAFSIALDRFAAVRNTDVFVGDQSAIAVTVYEKDGDTEPASLTGSTATLDVIRCGVTEFTAAGVIAGGVATFDLTSHDLSNIVGRNLMRMKLTHAGASNVVLSGALTVLR